ncbi:hypothetical protein [Geothrix sp. PMB-07]|uniref:hypothetical protein n=1 Tax=Geothrix sp. PMB-07 TaxID=3068640 RepID=UPI0027421817|nr:hypothetical protein [Geothrix sp. PMB-07]WLT32314.1 hypothetical protein Q9293_03065 [Geothrix sp. PMB-07]
MHIEPPKHGLRSLREFLKEYLMLVVGILTALGLEHVISHHNHMKAAELARQQIAAELRVNLEEVNTSLANNLKRRKPLEELAENVVREIKSGASQQTINEHVQAQLRSGFSVGTSLPTLRHEAWDVAVANQSATYIPDEALRRYSAAYATQRDSMAVASQGALANFGGPRLIDALTDLELKRVEPLQLLRVLSQLLSSLNSTQTNLKEIQVQLEASLKGETGAQPTKAH